MDPPTLKGIAPLLDRCWLGAAAELPPFFKYGGLLPLGRPAASRTDTGHGIIMGKVRLILGKLSGPFDHQDTEKVRYFEQAKMYFQFNFDSSL